MKLGNKLKITRDYTLDLPNKDGTVETLHCAGSVVIVGANGSGKTRLGTWIEFTSPQRDRVHRISAQKSLAMPDNSTPISIEKAERDLLFGYADLDVNQELHYKQHSKFGNKPAVSQLVDYQKLMVYLFSEHTEESSKYLAASKATTMRVTPPITKVDIVKEIWEKLLPHRELIIGGLRIQTRIKTAAGGTYNSSEMSDGERVMFYLIGQCLAAPQNGIIVIDEPELHLHKSIQAPLWTEIEKRRSDCLFVYLTHDVDFAASQEDAHKIWLKSFDGAHWEWEIFISNRDVPEDLLLEVLGSRKPVIFVEGDNGSFDTALYRVILKDFLIIPRGSCSEVIQSVKAMKANSQLHHLMVYGIIDRDRRVDAEIAALEKEGVFVLEVAEVENLFCTREIIGLVSQRLARNVADDFSRVSSFVFSRLSQELEHQISLRAASEIKFKLNLFDAKAKGSQALTTALGTLINGIDVNDIYADCKSDFDAIIAKKDYESLLKLFNRKTLASQVSTALSLSNGSLPELVIRLAKTDCRDEIATLLKKYFGNFAQFIT